VNIDRLDVLEISCTDCRQPRAPTRKRRLAYQTYETVMLPVTKSVGFSTMCMHKRIHSSLGYPSPAEFKSQRLAQRHV
jgi:hypothetical protein